MVSNWGDHTYIDHTTIPGSMTNKLLTKKNYIHTYYVCGRKVEDFTNVCQLFENEKNWQ